LTRQFFRAGAGDETQFRLRGRTDSRRCFHQQEFARIARRPKAQAEERNALLDQAAAQVKALGPAWRQDHRRLRISPGGDGLLPQPRSRQRAPLLLDGSGEI